MKSLPSNVLEKYEDRCQEEAINLAGLEDLVRWALTAEPQLSKQNIIQLSIQDIIQLSIQDIIQLSKPDIIQLSKQNIIQLSIQDIIKLSKQNIIQLSLQDISVGTWWFQKKEGVTLNNLS